MKRFFVTLMLFIGTAAVAHTINWYVDGNIFHTTTCESGEDITPPTAPEKYGYTFKEWRPAVYFVDYIASDGSNYIDTNIKVFNYVSIETKFQMLAKKDQDWFGTADNILNWNFDSAKNLDYFRYGSTKSKKIFFEPGYTVNDFNFVLKPHTLKIDFISNRPVIHIDNILIGTMDDTDIDFSNSQSTIKISSARNPSYARWYSFKIFDNGGNVLFYGKPAVDMNGNAGMYDLVTKQMFYASSGPHFTAGNTIE